MKIRCLDELPDRSSDGCEKREDAVEVHHLTDGRFARY